MGWLSKRNLCIFLLLAGLSLACPAGAETLIGTVVSTGDTQFIFRQIPNQESKTMPAEIRVVFLPATARGPFSSGPAFPLCVRKDKTIRISGSFDLEKNIFLAREIHGVPGRGRDHDPTGVRARLGRCRHPRGRP